MLIRRSYEIVGIVQGVGFRPTIYSYAIEMKIGGSILNSSGMVILTIEGEEKVLNEFIENLTAKLPSKAKITSIKLIKEELGINDISSFKIEESCNTAENYRISIGADLAMCTNCAKEVINKSDRRYRYPFTTCIDCGPRYTVVNSMPYDRCRTTLVDFPLCQECSKEYTDPLNRRFHAESTACPICGPTLSFCDENGDVVEDKNEESISLAKKSILDGEIVAIRGIGGFLLSLDAKNRDAILKLRERKKRPHQSFAVMIRDIKTIEKYCIINEAEKQLLQSSASPIVILKIKSNGSNILPFDLLSPDTNTLGVMLPYTPLHMLLFDDDLEVLVMTSGNKRSEPICIKNKEAFSRLKVVADKFLIHNREINLRNDDSLAIIDKSGESQLWRRSRGFSPEPIIVNKKFNKVTLTLGSELKNSIALAFDNEVIISPHIGDLATSEAVDALEKNISDFIYFFRKEPELVVTDMHPDMHSTRIGNRVAKEKAVKTLAIQHHLAHAWSVMGEYSLDKAVALVFDGTGYGTDGTIWGAETFIINQDTFSRVATFSAFKLLGGDLSVNQISKQLISRWLSLGANIPSEVLNTLGITDVEFFILKRQFERDINSIKTHSAGRLFDSVSRILGVSPNKVTYEGQAAIKLETAANMATVAKNSGLFQYEHKEENGMLYIDWEKTFENFSPDSFLKTNKESIPEQALDFHISLADASIDMIEYAIAKTDIRNIVISGGVFMNKILCSILREKLDKKSLKLFENRLVPPNDGGISFGQAFASSYLIEKRN